MRAIYHQFTPFYQFERGIALWQKLKCPSTCRKPSGKQRQHRIQGWEYCVLTDHREKVRVVDRPLLRRLFCIRAVQYPGDGQPEVSTERVHEHWATHVHSLQWPHKNSPSSPEFIWGNLTYNCIFHRVSTLRWHRWLGNPPCERQGIADFT